MATDDVAQDVSQVTDFHFHTCRKFRIFPSGTSDGENVRNRLATSSQLGVTFAVVSNRKIICFQTKSISSYKVTRENMNVEVTDFPIKNLEFQNVSSINDMGINSDGTLLAILHTFNNDVSVDVFDIRTLCSAPNTAPFKPICQTRVGTDATNQGSAFEWNPAFPDTFAASSTDRSILVAKIDVKNPNSQTLVGIGKLGAVTTAISWSPKGKQLTIGDSLGKVVQLKPELDVVRSQFGPDHQPSYGKVTGLCWLATTEWLVSFSNGADHDAYLMRCKKDKPTEWIHYHELSYASSKWHLPAQLFPATQLLIDWNIVLVGNSKTSEIVTVGKREDWTTWVTVEGEAIYLPTTKNSADTVPIGIAIDRTQTEEVLLKPDGSKKHRPSPLVMCLTNDGVLTAHHVISTYEPHKPCQIQTQNIPIAGASQPAAAAPIAPATSTPVQQVPAAQPSTLFQQKPPATGSPALNTALGTKPAFGGAPTAVPSAIFSAGSGTPKTVSFSTAATPAASTPAAPAPSANPAAPVEALKTPAKPDSPPPEPVTPPEVKRAEQLALKKKAFIERIQKTNVMMASTKDAVMKMSFAVGSAKVSILECAEVVKASLADSKEVTDELKNLIASIEWMSERTKHTVKEMDFEIEEKMEFVSSEDDGERILEKLRDMSENEKMMRFNKLENAADMLNGKFAECTEQIRKLRSALAEKESLRKQAVLSPLRTNSNLNQLRSGAETEIALKVMRNVTKIIVDTRERIQRTELEFIHFQRDVKAYKEESKKASNTITSRKHADISILEEEDAPHRRNLTDSEIMKARNALVQRIQKRGPVKTKDVKVETFQKVAPGNQKKREDPMNTVNLSNAIMKLSMTPRRVMGTSSLFSPATATSSVRRDATTQADEPPVVQTVVVTVDNPAKPASAAPIVSTPLAKPSTTTSAATTTTSKLLLPSKDEPKTVTSTPAPSTPAPSSSIFSGSLFGTKTAATATAGTSPMAPKSSIFGSPLSNSGKQPEKAKTPEPVVVPKEEPKEAPKEATPAPTPTPKVEEVKVESAKTPEAPKVEQKTSEPAVTAPAPPKTPIVEEKKEEPATATTPAVPKTPSFSFNTSSSSTQSTPKPASSIFGGGLKAQDGSTPAATATPSIFGAAAKSTPAASSSSTSIFGGGAKTGSSPFGNFGQATAQPAQAAAAPASTGPVSFSFNTAAAANTSQPKPSFGSFGAPSTAPKSTAFGAAAAAAASPSVPNVDDGMEDDSMVNGGGPGGFMSGLGNSSNTSNTSSGNNPFAPKPATGSTASSSWLFSGGSGNQQQAKPSFSFTNPASSQPQASASSSSGSVFGGAPKFGSQPVFGAKPFGGGAASTGGGGLSKNASIFGGAAASTTAPSGGGGFAQFATGQGTSSLFGGSGAAQPNTSIFGGGANTQTAPSSSIFGGGASANSNKPSSFSSWR